MRLSGIELQATVKKVQGIAIIRKTNLEVNLRLSDRLFGPKIPKSIKFGNSKCNSLKTEIVVTMNLREWRHFFKLRTSKRAHPQMREISIPLLKRMSAMLPPVFDDIQIDS